MLRVLFLGALLGVTAVVAGAGEVARVLRIEAPASVPAGRPFHVTVVASTNAGQGEQVGMFQVDASRDGGRTWQPMRYVDSLGTETHQQLDFDAAAVGTTVQVRVRVAFRGGLAGNVDCAGRAIRWHESWAQWAEPPARSATIAVTAP